MKKKILIVIVLVIIILGFIYYFVSQKESIYVGTVQATQVDISARVPSTIKSIHVKEGERVNQNDVLIQLSCEDIALKKNALGVEIQRAKKLLLSGALAQEKYDHTKNMFDEIELSWAWCEIKSPMNATVMSVYKEEGEWVAPGIKLISLAQLDDLWLNVYVDQEIMSKIRLDQQVSVYLAEVKKTIQGRVMYIHNEAEFTPKNVLTRKERTRLVYRVKIGVKNQDELLKPGMLVEVFFDGVK